MKEDALFSCSKQAEALAAQQDSAALPHLDGSRGLEFFERSPHHLACGSCQRGHLLLHQVIDRLPFLG